MQTEYQTRIKAHLLDRTWYKLVDCLEEVTDFWNYGKDLTTMPTYNTYMPTRNHIMPKPNLNDSEGDDASHKYNLQRVTPYQYLNPLKSKL